MHKSSINTHPEAQKRDTAQNRAQYEWIGGQASKTAKNETGVQSTFRDISNVAQCIFYELYIFETRIYKQSSIYNSQERKPLLNSPSKCYFFLFISYTRIITPIVVIASTSENQIRGSARKRKFDPKIWL